MILNTKILCCIGAGLTLSLASFAASAHNGHGDELPWQACTEAKKNDPCEYINSHGDVFRGNCKVFSNALMCVRNQPIFRAKNASSNTMTKEKTLPLESNKTETKLNKSKN